MCFYGDSIIADAHNYKFYNYENGDLPGYEIKCIFRDSQNRMWIGMLGGGFSVCNPSEDYRNLKFVHYSTTDGLVNNMVESIIEDKTGKYGLPLSMVYLVFHLIRKLLKISSFQLLCKEMYITNMALP